jgi:hypothetical protein
MATGTGRADAGAALRRPRQPAAVLDNHRDRPDHRRRAMAAKRTTTQTFSRNLQSRTTVSGPPAPGAASPVRRAPRHFGRPEPADAPAGWLPRWADSVAKVIWKPLPNRDSVTVTQLSARPGCEGPSTSLDLRLEEHRPGSVEAEGSACVFLSRTSPAQPTDLRSPKIVGSSSLTVG